MAFFMENADAKILYDFQNEKNISDWIVVDDVVMGGRSIGSLSVDKREMVYSVDIFP